MAQQGGHTSYPGYTMPLAALTRDDAAIAGSKGANLGELIRAGMPVPDGFVVTGPAYAAHLQHSGLTRRLPRLLADAPDGTRVREAIRAAPLPRTVAVALRTAYRDLVGDPARGAVAVRSSAPAEDLPAATMAGQHETVLNVVGEADLADAVRECWASLWTARAIDYRRRHRVAEAGMAVVVQRMVPAERAGVMVTADPVTGARDRIVVDAAAGLGEAVVAGLVTPDHVVLDKRSGRIRAARPGRGEVRVRPRAGGGTEQVAGTGAGPVLDRAALRRLARLGARAERHFGAPQDIEWAWYRGRPYLVQSRPATALPPPPPATAYGRLFAALMAEVLPVRPYPLDVTTWFGALYAAVAAVGRDLGLGGQMLGVPVVEDGVLLGFRPPRLRPDPRVLLLPLRVRRYARHARGDDDVVWARLSGRVRALARQDLDAVPWPEVVATLREAGALPPELVAQRLRHVPEAVDVLWLVALLWLVRRLDLLGDLLSGTDNKTAETSRALDALAGQVRADPDLAELFATRAPADLPPLLADRHPAFLAELHAFLDRYGHRETASPMLATQPTWRDAPDVVLGLLQARSATHELLSHPLLRPAPARRLVDRWLAGARRAFQARENGRFYLTLALPVVRAAMLALGRRLHGEGVLDRAEDVFHLTLAELAQVPTWPPPAATRAALRAAAQRRAAARDALAGTPLFHPGWFAQREDGSGQVVLRGMPGSPGVAEGPVRVVRGARDFHRLRPGEVLVTPYTNPAWTPLFPRAAAVVVDTGGAMSHAAIVAREYRIPAVMATGEGTRRLADGQRVRVDGGRGVVAPA